MGIFDRITTGKVETPIRLVVYGVDGWGKSTFAAGAPSPLFITTEKGTAHLDVARIAPDTFAEIFDVIEELYESEHEFKTLVLDSVGWAEDLARREVCKEHDVNSIEGVGYGKGWVMLREKFRTLFAGFDALVEARNMNIVCIGHTEVKRFNDPEHDPYDRYELNLDPENAKRLRQWADCVLFANYDTSVRKDEKTLGAKAKAKSYNKHILHAVRTAAFDAKNRYGLPDRIVLPNSREPADNWGAFASALSNSQN